MTAEPNGNTWDRATICKLINDRIIGGATWTQIASALKDENVHIRRGLHGSQKKTWTTWTTYAYYKDSSEEMKLPKEDWPKVPKAPKKGAKKAPAKKKAAPVRRKKRKAPSPAQKKRVKKKVSLRKAEREIRLRDMRPASLAINMTDEGAKVHFVYRGAMTDDLREVCGELLEIFNRLNAAD
jgi:hypothetical protein